MFTLLKYTKNKNVFTQMVTTNRPPQLTTCHDSPKICGHLRPNTLKPKPYIENSHNVHKLTCASGIRRKINQTNYLEITTNEATPNHDDIPTIPDVQQSIKQSSFKVKFRSQFGACCKLDYFYEKVLREILTD